MNTFNNSVKINGAPGPAYQSAEVAGIITTVNFPQQRGDPTTFRIHCPNMGKTFDAVCNLFCPIRQGDTIYALCMIGPDGRLHVSRPPFVQPAMDRDSMIQCFMRSLRQGYGIAVKLYTIVSKIAGGDDSVIPFLTGISQSWNDTHNTDILFMFHGIEPDDIKKLLNWWHKERNLRRLYLFGLNKKEINGCRMTCDEIYQKCMINPYSIPAIPLEKCDDILDRINKRPEPAERTKGAIIRVLWKNLHDSGWTGTPTRFLARQFPNIKEHVESLKNDYGMVAEMETAYLKFPHHVETWIADYMISKCREDYIKYDTPIDQRITLDNGKIIERLSAHFTRELSEDQQKAVQGALDHTLSIVTGSPGTGKCLKLGTPILMFDGSIKKIETIKEGELVMGPDSQPRKVLSKCYGIDDMFEIIPSKGRSFTCNSPHVLTLKGIQPYIQIYSSKLYEVKYTHKGIKYQKSFNHRDEAEKFLSLLDDDIFDIPLNEFLMRNYDDQQYSYLFHVEVDFPERPILTDPYTVGFLANRGIVELSDVYKINSRDIRMKILGGFIDANAHKDSCSCAVYLQISNEKLANDIEYISFSLGFMVLRVDNRLTIYGDKLNDIPSYNRYKYKALPYKNHKCQKYIRATCQRFEVNPVGKGEYCGFELDGDGRFLLGDFLVTHNTTCLGQIMHNLELRGIPYAVCSFTGKAVARIREVTKKRNPSTMHRLISNTRKNRLDKRSNQFEKDIPLVEYEHVIIDEASMVTTELLYDFLQAYPNIQKLTLIGDVNQLLPIGWGSLFYQLLKSETIPTYRLTTNYRVYTADGERDGIILNANAMVTHDPMYPFEFVQTSNFSVIEGPIERVYDIIRGCFSGGVRAEQLVVITPYNRSLDILNRTFQDIYNEGARFTTDSRGVKWMISDRVMLTENDQEIGVFNGESGTIRDITQQAILVDFGQSGCHEFLLEPNHQGRTNHYYRRHQYVDEVLDGDEGDIDDERTVKRLIHSYALTVDKSQGSEYDFVIVYIPEFNTGSFLNKNRIYTSITRTKRACWMVVTDTDALNIAAVKSPPYRCENLARRLSGNLPNIKPFKLTPPIPAIEMNGDMPIMPEDAIDMGFDCDDFE